MAHIRHAGLGFQVRVLFKCKVFPFCSEADPGAPHLHFRTVPASVHQDVFEDQLFFEKQLNLTPPLNLRILVYLVICDSG